MRTKQKKGEGGADNGEEGRVWGVGGIEACTSVRRSGMILKDTVHTLQP